LFTLAITLHFILNSKMTEYRDRDSIALASMHTSATLNNEVLRDIDPANLMRTAGNARLFDNLVFSGVNANHQHGPTAAAYLVADFTEDIMFVAFRLATTPDGTSTDDRIEHDVMQTDVNKLAQPFRHLSKALCTTAVTACVLHQSPDISEKFLAGGVELRIAPDGSSYTAILVPRYLRNANRTMERYIRGIKEEGRGSKVTDEMLEIAYTNNAAHVTRTIAASIALNILDDYRQIDALEATLRS